MGASVCRPFATKVIRELDGACRYASFKGRCNDLISMTFPKMQVIIYVTLFFRVPRDRMGDAQRNHASPPKLLTCARHMVVPVHVVALWVVTPGPDVKLEEWSRDTIAIRSID